MKGRILNIVLVLVLATLRMAANAGSSGAQQGPPGPAEAQQATSIFLAVQEELGANPQDSAVNSGYFVADSPQLNPETSSLVSRDEDFADHDATPGAKIEALLASAVQVTTGWHHSCALTDNGAVKCWGSNGQGRLGDGTTINRNIPVDVVGLNSGVEGVAGGGSFTCALTQGQGVKCWGANAFGQLGDGTTTDRHTPVAVAGLSSGVSAIAVGFEHACVLTSNGGIKCWGRNASGQLGDGTLNNRLTPVDVVGLTNGVVAVAARGSHTCALIQMGGVKCWGDNSYGQLGDGTRTRRLTPVSVVGLATGVASIAGGSTHTCALTQLGGAKCWGDNSKGQLGDGTTTMRLTPVNVVSMGNGVLAIGAGVNHTCGVTAIGAAKCWGSNFHGELGDGTFIDRSIPTQVVGLNFGISAIAPGAHHTCGHTAGDGAKCWGDNFNGELGDGTYTRSSTPVNVVGLEGSGVTGSPVILVHGWMGDPRNALETWRSCQTGLELFNNQNPRHSGWYSVAQAMAASGYSVYVANLDSSPLYTPSIETNAVCLKQQIATVASHDNRAILIAHSMGGLVSRAYLENEDLYRNQNVSHLITLGSPHAGVNWTVLRRLLRIDPAVCIIQPAVCQFSTDGALITNLRYPDRARDSGYTLIGGVSDSILARIFGVFEGPNDTFVGLNSARGFYWPLGTAVDNDNGRVGRYQTVSDHGGYFTDDNTIDCIRSRLGLGGSCDVLSVNLDDTTITNPPLTGQTQDLNGTINSGQIISRSLAVDTSGASVFMLTWSTGALSLTLTNPDSLVITPSYAAAHPAEVSYSSGAATAETPPWASYAFTNTVPGMWSLAIESTSAPPEGASYLATVYMETDLQLTAAADQTLYQIGETATFTASLQGASGAVVGASVAATIARSDGVTDTVPLVDQGNGNYLSPYVIPNAPGSMFASVVATGVSGGEAFNRQVDFALSVASPFVSLNGQYGARTPDGNGDGNFDALLVDVGIEATTQVTLTMSAALASPSITSTLTAITTTVVPAGFHTLTLSFPGRSIHRARASGPYTVTDLLLQDFSRGGVVADAANNVLTTQFYDFRQFGLRGDVDDSCEVDIQDVIGIASAWNTSGFDPVLDINRDGVITIADVMLAAGNWGASCWQ